MPNGPIPLPRPGPKPDDAGRPVVPARSGQNARPAERDASPGQLTGAVQPDGSAGTGETGGTGGLPVRLGVAKGGFLVHAPRHIRLLRDAGVLELAWDESDVYRLPFRLLRGSCPCASCVEEMTGRRIYGLADVPPEIAPVDAELAGNYALRIVWNDGHNTGLYTWEYLRALCDAEGAQQIA